MSVPLLCPGPESTTRESYLTTKMQRTDTDHPPVAFRFPKSGAVSHSTPNTEPTSGSTSQPNFENMVTIRGLPDHVFADKEFWSLLREAEAGGGEESCPSSPRERNVLKHDMESEKIFQRIRNGHYYSHTPPGIDAEKLADLSVPIDARVLRKRITERIPRLERFGLFSFRRFI